jgi:hypothetical protein
MSVTSQRGGSGAKAHQFALGKPRDGDMVQALMSNAIDATLPNVSEAVPQVADGSFIGILTALHERQRSGRGQWVHTSAGGALGTRRPDGVRHPGLNACGGAARYTASHAKPRGQPDARAR